MAPPMPVDWNATVERPVDDKTPREMPVTEGLRRRRDRYAWRAIVALTVVSSLGFIAVAALVTLGVTTRFDVQVTLELQELRSRPVYWLLFAVSWPGFIPRSLVIAGLMLVGLLAARLFVEARFLVYAFLLTTLYQPLKIWSHRARPLAGMDGIVVYGHATGYSFPSGHVLSYTLIFGLLAYFAYTLATRGRALMLAFLFTAIALVGPSRLYLGQHWFSDVLASYLLGVGFLLPLLVFYRRAKLRQHEELQAA